MGNHFCCLANHKRWKCKKTDDQLTKLVASNFDFEPNLYSKF